MKLRKREPRLLSGKRSLGFHKPQRDHPPKVQHPKRAKVAVAAALLVAPSVADARPHPEAKWCPPTVARCQRPPMTEREKRAMRLFRVREAHRRMFRFWSRQYIPSCTWYGESGPGPEFARWRYSVMNTQGSGARGKFQLMPLTHAAWCKFCDWSRADQEYAAHRLYQSAGTSPWSACA